MAEALRLGFAGLGMAAGRLIAEISRFPFIKLTAAADLRANARERFREEFRAECFGSVEELCRSPHIDAVYVATPHEFHARHSIRAMENRKHVIVEKPMALSVEEADAMNRTAEKYGVTLLAGHTHSFDPPIQKITEIVQGGELGKLLMISTSYYKDHIYRPFPDEDIRMSRGVVLNQGPHQVDAVRLIGGGLVKSVRAMSGVGDPSRRGEGHYVCYLEFEDGAAASLVYSGYAYFDTGELIWGIGEGGEIKDPERHVKARRFFKDLGSGAEREKALAAKLEEWRYGGARPAEWVGEEECAKHQPFFGLTVVTCEKGDLRQSPDGLFIYDEEGRREIPLVKENRTARELEMREFYDAIVNGRPVFHGGRWATATLEVCLAILQSAEERREIHLSHQVATPRWWQ